METNGPSLQPGLTERVMDGATDASHTVAEVSASLRNAVNRLADAVAAAGRPGMPLATLSAVTRGAPLASLFIAFLIGVAVARRR